MIASRRTFALVAPYAVWMALMAFLPQSAFCYLVRGVATAAMLAVSRALLRSEGTAVRIPTFRETAAAVAAGLGVLAVWIAPDALFGAGERISASASPYSPETCGAALTAAKLAASALVIPAAEELFFRKWLVEFAGFWWMVGLFAVEHGERWHVGALAGVAYGIVAKRHGIGAAIVAHSVTNLALGALVVWRGWWWFW